MSEFTQQPLLYIVFLSVCESVDLFFSHRFSVCVCVCDDEEFTEQRAAICLSDINAEVYGLRAH